MFYHHPCLDEFEIQEITTPVPQVKKLRIFEEMFQHAVEPGVFPAADPLAGFQDDIERTKKIYPLRPTSRTTCKGA